MAAAVPIYVRNGGPEAGHRSPQVRGDEHFGAVFAQPSYAPNRGRASLRAKINITLLAPELG